MARTHSLTFLFIEIFYRLDPREKDSTPNKKKHPVRFFFFSLRAARAPSRFFFWKSFIGSVPERTAVFRKKKNPVRVFFLFRDPDSLTLLFIEIFYRLDPREKDNSPNEKNNTSSAHFSFLLPARPGLTHSLIPVIEYYKY